MNLKTLRKIREILRTAKFSDFSDGIMSGILSQLLPGEKGNEIWERLSEQDYLELGLPQIFSAQLVESAPISKDGKEYFKRYNSYFLIGDTVSWVTLNCLDKNDMRIFFDWLILEQERNIITATEYYLKSGKPDITPFLLSTIGFSNSKRETERGTEAYQNLTRHLLLEMGLSAITVDMIYQNRHRLELSEDQANQYKGNHDKVEKFIHLVTEWMLTPDQVTTLVKSITEVDQYSPQNQSRSTYYLKELEEKLTQNPNSLALNNGITAIRRYLNLKPTTEYRDPLMVLNQIPARYRDPLAVIKQISAQNDHDFWFGG